MAIFRAMKTSTSNITKRFFSKSLTHNNNTDENPRTHRIFRDRSEILKGLTFHLGGRTLPSDSHTRLLKAPQPVTSQTSAPAPGDSKG